MFSRARKVLQLVDWDVLAIVLALMVIVSLFIYALHTGSVSAREFAERKCPIICENRNSQPIDIRPYYCLCADGWVVELGTGSGEVK